MLAMAHVLGSPGIMKTNLPRAANPWSGCETLRASA